MELTLGVVIDKYIDQFHTDLITSFEAALSSGLNDYNTPMIEQLSIQLICLSPDFMQFYKPVRPKYIADKTVKIRGSVTPEVRLYKCLDFEYIQDFESYQAAADSAECLKLLSLTFIHTIRNLKYPAALKTFDKEEFCKKIESICIENGFISPADLETPIL